MYTDYQFKAKLSFIWTISIAYILTGIVITMLPNIAHFHC